MFVKLVVGIFNRSFPNTLGEDKINGLSLAREISGFIILVVSLIKESLLIPFFTFSGKVAGILNDSLAKQKKI